MEKLIKKILKRENSLFIDDFSNNEADIKEIIKNSRVLIIGAAGSIGSAFVKQLSKFSPAAMHLVDISENNLVEVVRDLRSTNLLNVKDFRTLAIALGTIEFDRFIDSEPDYDYVINFSALKHVRSERDPFTLMRMINTNACYFKDLLDNLKSSSVKNVFSVSSDKAVNPGSIMGATKILMERILLAYSNELPFSTARFANVAFSDGSLLHGFINRLAKRQPIAAPIDVRRYFISHEEAGQLCLLACFLGKNRDVYFPKLNESLDLINFAEIAKLFVNEHGFEVLECASENEAIELSKSLGDHSKKWPCYFFNSDTTGEKPYEEFYTSEDVVDFDTYKNIGVHHQNVYNEQALIDKAFKKFNDIKQDKVWNKQDMLDAVKIVVPELNHIEKGKNLDQKM